MAPSNITIRKIEAPTEDNVSDATEILCSVMQDDPLCYASTGGDLTRLPMLIHPMIAQIAFRLGDMYGAFDENGTLVGFQAWVPPGKALFATDEDKAPLGPYIEQLPTDEIKAFVLHTMGCEISKLEDVLTGIEHAELNTHWCQFNFIKAEYHGKGISKAIMKLPFEKSNANGWSMALVTANPKNVAIYEHHGFVNEGYKLIHTPLNVVPFYAFVKRPSDS